MINPQIQKLIIIFITILFVGYIGYGLFNATPSPDAFSAIPANPDSELILALADKIEKTTIDSSIFSDKLFVALIDTSSVVTPEEQGRDNPFYTIGLDAVQSQTVKSVVIKR